MGCGCGTNGWANAPPSPAAAVPAVAGTAATIGSMVRTVPAGCVPVNYGGIVYQQCGSTWYQPQFVGTTTSYVVVTAPR